MDKKTIEELSQWAKHAIEYELEECEFLIDDLREGKEINGEDFLNGLSIVIGMVHMASKLDLISIDDFYGYYRDTNNMKNEYLERTNKKKD